jgi:hypothetical protein
MEYKVASVAQRYDHLCYEKEYDSYRTTEYRRSLEVERALVLYTRINSRIWLWSPPFKVATVWRRKGIDGQPEMKNDRHPPRQHPPCLQHLALLSFIDAAWKVHPRAKIVVGSPIPLPTTVVLREKGDSISSMGPPLALKHTLSRLSKHVVLPTTERLHLHLSRQEDRSR